MPKYIRDFGNIWKVSKKQNYFVLYINCIIHILNCLICLYLGACWIFVFLYLYIFTYIFFFFIIVIILILFIKHEPSEQYTSSIKAMPACSRRTPFNGTVRTPIVESGHRWHSMSVLTTPPISNLCV